MSKIKPSVRQIVEAALTSRSSPKKPAAKPPSSERRRDVAVKDEPWLSLPCEASKNKKKPAPKPVRVPPPSKKLPAIPLPRIEHKTEFEADYFKDWTEKFVWITTVCTRLGIRDIDVVRDKLRKQHHAYVADGGTLFITVGEFDSFLIDYLAESLDQELIKRVITSWAASKPYLVKNDINILVDT